MANAFAGPPSRLQASFHPWGDSETLGAKLELRRRELGLNRVQAAALLSCDPKTFMWWERNESPPFVHAYPAIIEFLGYEPWRET